MARDIDYEYFVTKTFNPNKGYSCAFRNWRATSHCRLIHGYDLVFQITFACQPANLTPEGWVIDFGGLDWIKTRIEDAFDHTILVAEDDPALQLFMSLQLHDAAKVVKMQRVGCEAFSSWLAALATDYLMETDQLSRVRVRTATVFEHGANVAGMTFMNRGSIHA